METNDLTLRITLEHDPAVSGTIKERGTFSFAGHTVATYTPIIAEDTRDVIGYEYQGRIYHSIESIICQVKESVMKRLGSLLSRLMSLEEGEFTRDAQTLANRILWE